MQHLKLYEDFNPIYDEKEYTDLEAILNILRDEGAVIDIDYYGDRCL